MKKILLPVMLVFCLSGALNAAEKEALETIDRANKMLEMIEYGQVVRIGHNYFGMIHWATEIAQKRDPNDEQLKQFAEIFYNAKYNSNATLYDSLTDQERSDLKISLQDALIKVDELKQYIIYLQKKEALDSIDRANKMLSSDEIGRIRHNYFGLIHWATEIVQVVYPNDERLKQFAEIFYNAKYDPNAMLYDSLPNQKKSELNINLQNAIEKAGELKQYIVTIK